jgi:hypothetical protein
VNQVEVAGVALDLDPQHVAHEAAHLRREVVLLQALERAGRDVPHEDPRLGLVDRGLVSRRGASEDLDLDATGRELARELEHVDVHAAGVSRARLLQRRRVRREHRDALEHPPTSPR